MEPENSIKTVDDASLDILSTESFHLDSDGKNQGEERVSSLICDQCSCDDLSEKAVSFCADCVEYMCRNCNKHHERTKYTKNHKTLHGNDVPEDAKEFKRMKELTKCAVHPGNDISLICVDHDALLCALCMTKGHRNCEHIEAIEEHISHALLESELNELMEEVGFKIPRVKQEKVTHSECLEKKKDVTLQTINETANTLKGHVDEHANELTEKTMASVSLEMFKLKNDISRCECLQNSTNADKKLFEVSKMYGTSKERLVSQKCAYDSIKNASNEIGKMAEYRPVNIQHNTSFEIQNLKSEWSVTCRTKEIEQDLLSTDIQVEKSSEEFTDTGETERREEVTVREVIMVDQSTQVAQLNSEIESAESNKTDVIDNITPPKMQGNVCPNFMRCNVESDTDICSIVSICILECGSLVLLDANNSKLKVSNPELTIVASEPLPDRPVDLCVYKTETIWVQNQQRFKYRVAICFYDMKKIMMFSIEGKNISTIGSFPTRWYATGLTNYDEHLAIMFSDKNISEDTNSDDDIIELQVRREDGSIYCTVNDFDGRTICGPCKIRFAHEKLFVCERELVSVFRIPVGIGENFTFVSFDWYYKYNGFKGRGNDINIAMDAENWLYLCGTTSLDIHRVSNHDFRNNKVLLQLLGIPASLAFDNVMKSILVGYFMNDCISVFKLDDCDR